MTVQQLIDALLKCENKEQEVFFSLENGYEGKIENGYEWQYGFDVTDKVPVKSRE